MLKREEEDGCCGGVAEKWTNQSRRRTLHHSVGNNDQARLRLMVAHCYYTRLHLREFTRFPAL